MKVNEDARRRKLLFLQIAAAVVSIVLGLTQMTKESQPFVEKMQENRRQAYIQQRATEISQMQIAWQYRSNDGVWRYYSDPTNRYWARVNIQGVYEYSENPYFQMASSPQVVR